jgi:flagellar motor switch protein FliM
MKEKNKEDIQGESAASGGDDKPEESTAASGRVLDQEEIDSLLEFDDGDGNGIRELIKSAVVSYGRLPMLEVVFDRLASLASASLSGFTAGPAEVSVEGIGSIRFGAYLGSVSSPALLAIFKAKEWRNFGLIMIDADLAFAIFNVLLGGRHAAPQKRPDPRPYTTIEQGLIGQMVGFLLADQANAFQSIIPVSFHLDRLETNPGFANIARPGSAAIMTRFNVAIGEHEGQFDIVYPQVTLEPVRELLQQRFMGEASGRDVLWEESLMVAAWSTDLPLTAVLDEQKMSLNEVMNLKVGQTLDLGSGPKAEIDIRSGDVSVATGQLGRSGGRYSVRITRNLLDRPANQEGAA